MLEATMTAAVKSKPTKKVLTVPLEEPREIKIFTLSPCLLLEEIERISNKKLGEDARSHFFIGSFTGFSEIFELDNGGNQQLVADMQLVWAVFRGCPPAAQRLRLALVLQKLSGPTTISPTYTECREFIFEALKQLHNIMR